MSSVCTRTLSRRVLLESERRVLALIAGAAPLEEILECLVGFIEEQACGMRCAILLADAGQRQLRFAAGPNIPEDYKQGMQPYLGIMPDMGSCGTAAYLRQPVYTRDTAMDRLWEEFSQVAVRNGLRAVWSTPILSRGDAVLGTLAMYYAEPRLPDEEHIQLIDAATQMARIAIEGARDAEFLHMLLEDVAYGIIITDREGAIHRVNGPFAAMLGYTPEELRGRNFASLAVKQAGAAPGRSVPAPEYGPPGEAGYIARDGAIVHALTRPLRHPDKDSQARYLFSRVDKISDAEGLSPAQLSRRERQVLEFVIRGMPSKDIAALIGVSAASVDTYRSRIMIKLGIKDVPGLVRFAIRNGISSV